ncbi:hypothetical protein SteCoe_28939 [Stentor coeruleus]|uniref:Uncharacterized protein n=1 Tax=Stentor coeruleus TaxID=5963 RepID=A0A1R2B741_9CILI|nr:hypothetical protein SteCoe_28939 [Stentor coeruleus]
MFRISRHFSYVRLSKHIMMKRQTYYEAIAQSYVPPTFKGKFKSARRNLFAYCVSVAALYFFLKTKISKYMFFKADLMIFELKYWLNPEMYSETTALATNTPKFSCEADLITKLSEIFNALDRQQVISEISNLWTKSGKIFKFPQEMTHAQFLQLCCMYEITEKDVEDFENTCAEYIEKDKKIIMKIKEENHKYVKDEEEKRDKSERLNRENDRKHSLYILENEKKILEAKLKENNSLRYQMIIKNLNEDIRLLKKRV